MDTVPAADAKRKPKPVCDLPPIAHRIPDVCHIANVGRNTVYEAFASGDLIPIKWGRVTLVMDADLRQFLDRKRAAAIEQRAELSAQMSKVRRHQKARPVRAAA